MLKKMLTCITLLPLLAVPLQAVAVENPLKSQVRFVLPSNVTTVHEAALYLISPHHYKIRYAPSAPTESLQIGLQALPIVKPNNQLLSIEEALLRLLEPDQYLIVDRANKLISFGEH